MSTDPNQAPEGFFAALFRGILQDLIVMAIVFLVATAICAGVCIYYGLPLVLSLAGGFIMLGVVFWFRSSSLFFD